jgi:CRP/FNR family transcriptional regulator, cyclic AMP receptor protein
VTRGALGKVYRGGEVIVREGELGDCMFAVQEGEVEVVTAREGREVVLRVLGKGAIVGEMSLFDREVRSATVRARGDARLLTVDRESFLRRVHEDPSLAFNIVREMSARIRELTAELARLRARTE